MPLNMKNINKFTQWKKMDQSMYAECSENFQYTPRIY